MEQPQANSTLDKELSDQLKDPVEMLLDDHNLVRLLFTALLLDPDLVSIKNAGPELSHISLQGGYMLLRVLLEKLLVHEQLEEMVFYPTLKTMLGHVEEGRQLIDKSYQEHHTNDLLSRELLEDLLQERDVFESSAIMAKIRVLHDSTELHMTQEEKVLFPQVVRLFQESFGDEKKKKLEELAYELTKLKQRIESDIKSADNFSEKLLSLVKSKAAHDPLSEKDMGGTVVADTQPEIIAAPTGPILEEKKEETAEPAVEEKEEPNPDKEHSQQQPGKSEPTEAKAEPKEEEEEEEEEAEGKAPGKRKRKAKAGRKAKAKSKKATAAGSRGKKAHVVTSEAEQPAKRAKTR